MTDQPHDQKGDEELLADAIPIPPEEGEDDDALTPIDFNDDDLEAEDGSHTSMIRTIGEKKRSEAHWKRESVSSGQGASHVRTFVAKLRLDAVENLDSQVNAWLDEHPEFDVKFVSTSVGPLIGKTTENAMFITVWV